MDLPNFCWCFCDLDFVHSNFKVIQNFRLTIAFKLDVLNQSSQILLPLCNSAIPSLAVSCLKSGSTPSHHHHHQVRTPSHQTALWIRHCWRMPVTSAFFHFGLKSLRPFTMSAFCKFGLPSWHFGLQYWLFGPFRLYTGSKDRAHFVFNKGPKCLAWY